MTFGVHRGDSSQSEVTVLNLKKVEQSLRASASRGGVLVSEWEGRMEQEMDLQISALSKGVAPGCGGEEGAELKDKALDLQGQPSPMVLRS